VPQVLAAVVVVENQVTITDKVAAVVAAQERFITLVLMDKGVIIAKVGLIMQGAVGMVVPEVAEVVLVVVDTLVAAVTTAAAAAVLIVVITQEAVVKVLLG
jgi:hypothetical protein